MTKNQEALEALENLIVEASLDGICADHLINAIREALTSQTWQTIESAPRDGTEFYAYNIGWMRPKIMNFSFGQFRSVADKVVARPTFWQSLPTLPLEALPQP